MKNKIKKIIPLILCFVIIFGSCLTVNASIQSFPKLNSGQSILQGLTQYHEKNDEYMNFLNKFTVNSCEDDVYVVSTLSEISSSQFVYFLISSKPFNFSLERCFYDSKNVPVFYDQCSSYLNSTALCVDAPKINYNGFDYYYTWDAYTIGDTYDNLNIRKISNFINVNSYLDAPLNLNQNMGELFEKLRLSNFTWDDGVEMEYGSSPIVDILPPSNVSYFEAERPALQDYYFQLEWDNENTDDLNVEIAMDIKYKSNYLSFNENLIRCSWIDYYNYLMSSDGKKDGYVRELAMSMLDSLDIKYSESHVTIDSFYIRFARENYNTGQLEYSLWTKLYLNRNDKWYEPLINSSNGNTGYFDSEGNWIEQSVVNGGFVDGSEDVPIISPGLDMDGNNASPGYPNNFNPGNWDSNLSNVFDSFTNAIKSAFSFVGEFPAMLSDFFGFLPASVIGCISIGLVMVVVLRFLGR